MDAPIQEERLPIFACNVHTLIVTNAALVIAFIILYAAMRLFVMLIEASPLAAVCVVVALIGLGVYVGHGHNDIDNN